MLKHVACVFAALCLIATAENSFARKACPFAPTGQPGGGGSGFKWWYSPYCTPDSGSTGLLLGPDTTQSLCPNGTYCVSGLGDTSPTSVVGSTGLAREGYKRETILNWDDEFKPESGFKFLSEQWKIRIADKDEPRRFRYLKIMRLTLPQQDIEIKGFMPCGETVATDVIATIAPNSMVAGWEVAEPAGLDEQRLYLSPEFKKYPLLNADGEPDPTQAGVSKVAFRDRSESIITEVLMYGGKPEMIHEPAKAGPKPPAAK